MEFYLPQKLKLNQKLIYDQIQIQHFILLQNYSSVKQKIINMQM
jgi:hypothetical protein